MAEAVYVRTLILLTVLSYISETEEVAAQHLCGLHLIESLTVVCKGKGFYQGHQRGPHGLRPFGEQRSRKRATNKLGIVEKCCLQPCSYYDLQRYCRY
ncbi:insulin-like [Pelobates fuscus]|uniref:insulin-like n=1 Tax=Pelobates fuscus TaxID=191477 RepID=UPI002FE4EFAC